MSKEQLHIKSNIAPLRTLYLVPRTLCLVLCTSYLILCTSFTSASSDIDQAKEDFKKINASYQTAPNLYFDITYNMYESYQSKNVRYTYTGYYKKQKNNYHSHLLGIETIQNEQSRIVIDSADKKMIIADPLQAQQSIASVELEKVLSVCSAFKITKTSATETQYSMNFDKDNFDYSSIQLYADNQTFFIKKIVLYFNAAVPVNEEDQNSAKEKPRVEIVYSEPKQKINVLPGEFFGASYFTMKDGKALPANQYKNYELLNQRR